MRVIKPWTKEECDRCHIEFQATRTNEKVLCDNEELVCNDCLTYQKGYEEGLEKGKQDLEYYNVLATEVLIACGYPISKWGDFKIEDFRNHLVDRAKKQSKLEELEDSVIRLWNGYLDLGTEFNIPHYMKDLRNLVLRIKHDIYEAAKASKT